MNLHVVLRKRRMTYIQRACTAPFHKTDPPSRVQQASVASANKRGTREPKPASTLAAATLRTPLRDGLCSRGRRTRASGGLCKNHARSLQTGSKTTTI